MRISSENQQGAMVKLLALKGARLIVVVEMAYITTTKFQFNSFQGVNVSEKSSSFLSHREQEDPGSKIPLILQDLRGILTRTSCKSLQETYKTSCQDSYQLFSKILQDLARLTNSLVPGKPQSAKVI